LLRAVLSPGKPVLGVARVVVEELTARRLPLFYTAAMVGLLVLIPVSQDTHERLTYRLQTFFDQGLLLTFWALALATVVYACYSVSRDIAQQQIFLTVSKPIRWGQYLLGKWLGIMLVNALLVTVTGEAVAVMASAMRMMPAVDARDR